MQTVPPLCRHGVSRDARCSLGEVWECVRAPVKRKGRTKGGRKGECRGNRSVRSSSARWMSGRRHTCSPVWREELPALNTVLTWLCVCLSVCDRKQRERRVAAAGWGRQRRSKRETERFSFFVGPLLGPPPMASRMFKKKESKDSTLKVSGKINKWVVSFLCECIYEMYVSVCGDTVPRPCASSSSCSSTVEDCVIFPLRAVALFLSVCVVVALLLYCGWAEKKNLWVCRFFVWRLCRSLSPGGKVKASWDVGRPITDPEVRFFFVNMRWDNVL